MRLNRFADYGLRALIYLGTHDRRVTTEEIAQAYRISRSHLQKIIRELGRLGVVTMHRGRSGGLELSKAPSEISIGTVLRALDSETRLVECFDPERDQCTISPVCGMKAPLAAAEEAFFAALDDISLGDVLGPKRFAQLKQLLEKPS